MVEKIRFDEKVTKPAPLGTDYGIILDMNDMINVGGVMVPKVKRALLSTFPGGGGGGGVLFKNTLLVESTATPVAGKVFNNYADAYAYALTQSPGADNNFVIDLPSGEFSEDVVFGEHISIRGKQTILTGNLSSDYILTDMSGALSNKAYIMNCEIRNIDLSNGQIMPTPLLPILPLFNCKIQCLSTGAPGVNAYGIILSWSSQYYFGDFIPQTDKMIFNIMFDSVCSGADVKFGGEFILAVNSSFFGTFHMGGEYQSCGFREVEGGVPCYFGGAEINFKNCFVDRAVFDTTLFVSPFVGTLDIRADNSSFYGDDMMFPMQINLQSGERGNFSGDCVLKHVYFNEIIPGTGTISINNCSRTGAISFSPSLNLNINGNLIKDLDDFLIILDSNAQINVALKSLQSTYFRVNYSDINNNLNLFGDYVPLPSGSKVYGLEYRVVTPFVGVDGSVQVQAMINDGAPVILDIFNNVDIESNLHISRNILHEVVNPASFLNILTSSLASPLTDGEALIFIHWRRG